MATILEDILLPFFAIAVIFGGLYGLIYFFLKTRNAQRMAMIQNGLGADLVAPTPRNRILLWAILAIGTGAGVFLGNLLAGRLFAEAWLAYLAMIALTVGIGLVLYYRVVGGEQSKN